MEANHHWSVYDGSTHIDSGTRWGTEKSVMADVMAEFIEHPKCRSSVSYRFTAGGLTASSFGDEIGRTVAQIDPDREEEFEYIGARRKLDVKINVKPVIDGLDEMKKALDRVGKTLARGMVQEALRKALASGALSGVPGVREAVKAAQDAEEEELRKKVLRDQGFISQDVFPKDPDEELKKGQPVYAQGGIVKGIDLGEKPSHGHLSVRDSNGRVIHEQDMGLPPFRMPTEEELGLDLDRERELRAIREQYRKVRPPGDPMYGTPGKALTACSEGAHRISERRDEQMMCTKYVCGICGRGYAYPDSAAIAGRRLTEADVQRILS